MEWHREPTVEAPILVLALEGLFDIADAATAAVDHLTEQAEGRLLVASIDPEVFYDFTQQRPMVSIDQSGVRQLRWPANDAWELPPAEDSPPVIAISGIEPHLRWRTFAESVAHIAERCGARLVVTLGAMAGMAPHTRTLGVVGSAADPALADRLGLRKPSYEGPTGVVGALHVELDRVGLGVISLRVSVPHYVTQSPNAEATRALLKRLQIVTGIETDHQVFDERAREWRQRVDEAVASDDEMSRYVRQLESQVDQTPDLLPDGDAIAAELQAWLRDTQSDDG